MMSKDRSPLRMWLAAALAALMLMLSGCSMEGGYTRGMFSGYVLDKTEEEVAGKVGKPDLSDAPSPDTHRWVYKRKTFDSENGNQIDNETTVIFQRDGSGQFKATEVVYS
jgi:hypothetical protein